MIAIKDMEMPVKCKDCRFAIYNSYYGGTVCAARQPKKLLSLNNFFKRKGRYCPLVEVKDENTR